MTSPLLTIAIIARDEEKNLPSLFRSLAGISDRTQVVVVDTGSRDGTRRVAEAGGAEVHAFPWRDDFSAARNHSLYLARGAWILWLDADDELPGATRDWLRAHLGHLDAGSAYAFRVRSPDAGGGETTWNQIRLFPNGKGLRFRNPVHENIGEAIAEAGMAVQAAPAEILHTGYNNTEALERKRQRNRSLLSKAVTDPRAAASLWLAWGRMRMGDGAYAEAEQAFRQALARSQIPADKVRHEVRLAAEVDLGASLCYQNRIAEALQVYRDCPDGSNHGPWLLGFGKALWLAGQAAQARELWERCLKAGPDYAGVPQDWDGMRAAAGTLLLETRADELIPLRSGGPPDDPPYDAGGGGGSPRLDLSICTIVRDEAANLPDLIGCLPLGRAEWIVVDTGSNDGTPEILLQAGVKTLRFAWCDDFSAARNVSLRAATRGWILWLDADDRLDESFWEAIAPLLEGPKRAYRFLVRSPREQSRGDSFRQIRLFPNHLGVEFEGRIHEQLGTSLGRLRVPIAATDLEILHLGYDTAAKRGAKLKRNRALLDKERLEHPSDPAVIMEYGNCLYQSGDYSDACEAYLSLMPARDPRACGESPADEVLRHYPALLAETCAKLNREADAGEWFRLAARWNPSDIKPLYWLGKQALAANNVHGALEYFYAAVDRPVTVGKVATDNHTVRRNALALVVLCEIQLFGAEKAPRGREALRELIKGGLREFPMDHRVPWEFFRAAGADAEAEAYARAYLQLAPGDIALWEDLIEFLHDGNRHHEVLDLFAARPTLRMRSGVLEAFRGKCGEGCGRPVEETYGVYRDGLRKFPEDPTLLVYFSDFVNHNRLYSRCYSDLKAMSRPSETVRDFLRQMEALGYGKSGAA